MNSNQITKNIFYSMTAQILSLFISVVVCLFVPKFISNLQYAYWQIFLLYSSYVGFLHFGLLDGLVLRYSQYDYEKLDYCRVRSQFLVLLIITCFFSVLAICCANFFMFGINKQIVYLIAISIIIKNINTYTSYIFQITNRIKYYATLTILYKVTYLFIILSILIFREQNYIFLCLADIISVVVAILIVSKYNKKVYFGHTISLLETIKETWLNISSGFLLMIANISSMLLVGGAKIITQWHWSELIFGKVAFGFSISNLFLIFVNAISVVLFPTIKRLSVDFLPDLYYKLRQSISILLFSAMLLYFPCGYFLKIWLPKYSSSITFVGIILPLIIFSSKISLLTNNYLKAYRKEKQMFNINCISVLIAFLLYIICAYIFNNLTCLLICSVLVTIFSSVLLEIIVIKLINIDFKIEFIYEILLSMIFIFSNIYLSLFESFFIYSFFLLIYIFIHRIFLYQLIKNIHILKILDKD